MCLADTKEVTCKTRDQIEDRFLTGGSVLFLRNLKRFESTEYREDSIYHESKFSWHDFNAEVSTKKFIDIKKKEIQTQDLMISFDQLTVYQVDTLFDV